MEARRFFLPALLVLGLPFYRWLNPAPDLDFVAPLLALTAAMIGYTQANRESRGDRWALAFHRPASGRLLFAAKFLVGATLLAAVSIPFVISMWELPVLGQVGLRSGQSYWLAVIPAFLASLTWYAAGLYVGSRKRRTMAHGVGLLLI